MTKLFELLGCKLTTGTFGVEIECEGNNLVPVETDGWRTEDDGSLRGVFPNSRCEWVFKKPLPLAKAITAIATLAREQRKGNAKLDFSLRTSVHVHVNVQDLTEEQYFNFIYTYLLLEPVLLRYCGDVRRANRFCLSINDGEGLMDYISHLFQQGVKQIGAIFENDVRYAAINIAATKKYGSLEFRGMRGTLDVDILSTWIMALNAIREYAMENENVHSIHDKFVRNSPTEFMRSVLGDVSADFEYAGMEGDIRNNFSITLELVYAYKPKEKAVPVQKEAKRVKLGDWVDFAKLDNIAKQREEDRRIQAIVDDIMARGVVPPIIRGV